MGVAELTSPGPGTWIQILALGIGWLPLYLIARLLRVRPRPSHMVLGSVIAAFVGGMCCRELRRYDLLALPVDAVLIPPTGLAIHELARFAFLGAAGALGCEALLGWTARATPESASENRKSGKPPLK